MTPKELKNSILQLAIEGKLVEQRKEEGSAEILYAEIQKEKQKLIKQGKIKKEKELPEITDDEIPFEIPKSWKWVRLSNIINLLSGQDRLIGEYNSKGLGIPYLTGASSIDENNEIIINRWIENPSVIANMGNILLTCKGTIGKILILKEKKVHIARQFMAIQTFNINEKYVLYFLQLKVIEIQSLAKSIIPGIERKNIIGLICPLPPLAEQKRIVEKIEELMPLIDRYEVLYNRLNELNKEFPKKLKNAVLQKAIEGKLVPQIKSEGSAEDLYAEIQKEKQKLVEKKLILKKADTKPYFDSSGYPFSIPRSWRWVQLSDVSIIQEGAGIRKFQYRKKGTQLLCVTNILEGKIDIKNKQIFIDEEEYKKKYLHLTLKKGDIVTACSGGSWGKVAIFDSKEVMMLNTSTLRLRFFNDMSDSKYLYYLCKSNFFKNQLTNQLSGMQPNFGYAHYSRICFPFPPFAEQKRIVEKIEEILPNIEKLEKNII